MAYGSPAYVVDKVNGKMQNFVQHGDLARNALPRF